MISKEEFATIHTDFIESQDYIQTAHDCCDGLDFVCHHNAYLVAWFLRRRGHKDLHWVSGYYQCRQPEKRVHHSWIKLERGGRTIAIFEFDPRQLYERGGYDNDLMPSGRIGEVSLTISGIASIINPELVELPEDAKESPWVVSSNEVLLRYIEDSELAPQINFAEIDALAIEALGQFDLIRIFQNEDDWE